MRLALIFITLNLSVPAFCYSQMAKVSLKLKDATMKDVFREIEKQTEYVFFYYEGLLDNSKVNIEAKNQSVNSVLDKVLKGKEITYTVNDRQISLIKKEDRGKESELVPTSVMQQDDGRLTGRVIDKKGEALPGVTITITGSTRGVFSDESGNFEIGNIAIGTKLIASFIGMQNKEFTFDGKPNIIVVLEENVNELEEVTVVAFGKQKKESVISSISTINTKDLKIPSSNLTTSLAGRLSGLISYQRSGEPGQDDASFFVRGVTTFSYTSGPLILIDGIELSSSDLARLQPDDIASFSIMKDAVATALYGARGGNGVILVTTKEGREGNARISFRYETSLSSPTKIVELADPITYMNMNNEAVKTRNPSKDGPYSREKIDNTILGKNKYVYPANDWYDMLFKPQTINQRANFNVSGGGKVARYYIAGTFSQDNGVLKVDKRNNFNNNIDLKKYLLRSNININVTPTTEAIVRLHGTFDDYIGPIDGGSELYNKVVRTDPVLFPAVYEPDASMQHIKHTPFGNYDKGQYINPYADMARGYKEYSKSLMLAQFELKQNLNFITEGLNLRGLLNINRYSYFDVSRFYTPHLYSLGGYDKFNDTYSLSWINPTTAGNTLSYVEGPKELSATTYLEGAVNYDRVFADKHTISGLLVGNARTSIKPNASTLALSLPSRNVGLSGRFTYSFDGRYFGEFNFGYNGSERFAQNERFGFFPSAGLAWFVSNESFWNTDLNRIMSKLKFKATYGLVGNDAIGQASDRFFYMSEVNINTSARGYTWGELFDYSVNGVTTSRYANDKITWETSEKMNLGIEIGLFNKLELQADYYTEYRRNILMTRANIPTTMGLQATPITNIGEAEGSGIDLSVDYNHSFNRDLWITGRANFTYATAKYKVYEEIDYSETPWLSRIGQNVGQNWGYIAERLFVDQNDVNNNPVQTFGTYTGGDIKYRDINGDDKIDDLDMVPVGYPVQPEIIYGFGVSTGYKNIDFSCFFQGLARESFWINVTSTYPFVDTDANGDVLSKNALLQVYADSHWSEENPDIYALWPRFSDQVINNNTQQSTWFMRNGSFLRMKSLELGYTVPDHLTKRAMLKNFRIYLSGTNLFTVSKFKLWDPEMAGNGLGYPIQKVYNIGIQLSF